MSTRRGVPFASDTGSEAGRKGGGGNAATRQRTATLRRLTLENEQLRTSLDAIKRDHKAVLEAIISQGALLKKERLKYEMRCEALTAELELARAAGSRSLAIRLGELLTLQGAKIEALTAERDSWRRVAERLEGEKVEAQTRCQHLEQAVKDFLGAWQAAEKPINACIMNAHIHGTNYTGPSLGLFIAALASLLPAQEEKAQTDENRVSFAAGYSTLVDDHAALLKDMRELMSQAYLACGDMQDDIVERAVLRLGLDPFEISKIPEGEDRD